MGRKYTSGKYALGICDRCGQTFKLKELRNEIVKRSMTSTKVCSECFDPDHPQNFLGEYPVYDPQALKDSRPDSAELSDSRGLLIPVRQVAARATVGRVTVVVT